MTQPESTEGRPPSQLIDERIAGLGDWWMGTPVWEHDGILCTGETYKSVVKLTFAKGASLDDPAGLFNSSQGGKVRRAIDIHEGEKVDAGAFKALVQAAIALNTAAKARPKRAK